MLASYALVPFSLREVYSIPVKGQPDRQDLNSLLRLTELDAGLERITDMKLLSL